MEKFIKYKDKGLTGLQNLGNTCYLNSCLQILSHTYELNNILNDSKLENKLNNKHDSALLIEWNNLRNLMWSQNCTISPGKFVHTVQKLSSMKNNTQFTGFAQNDVTEFILFVTDCFHEALKREVVITISGKVENPKDQLAKECYEMIKKMYTKDYSEIWNLFYGIHVSQIKSSSTDEIFSQTPEPFFMINLPLPNSIKEPSLIDCFEAYVSGEELSGDNAWYNEKKSRHEDSVIKRIQYWSLPTILTIDLKRFNAAGRKNQKPVSFPLDTLNLSKYVIGYTSSKYIYSLYGVAYHSGGTSGGHYYSAVKNANGKWYLFNDTSVTEIKDESSIVTPKAYCLFYRKNSV